MIIECVRACVSAEPDICDGDMVYPRERERKKRKLSINTWVFIWRTWEQFDGSHHLQTQRFALGGKLLPRYGQIVLGHYCAGRLLRLAAHELHLHLPRVRVAVRVEKALENLPVQRLGVCACVCLRDRQVFVAQISLFFFNLN